MLWDVSPPRPRHRSWNQVFRPNEARLRVEQVGITKETAGTVLRENPFFRVDDDQRMIEITAVRISAEGAYLDNIPDPKFRDPLRERDLQRAVLVIDIRPKAVDSFPSVASAARAGNHEIVMLSYAPTEGSIPAENPHQTHWET